MSINFDSQEPEELNTSFLKASKWEIMDKEEKLGKIFWENVQSICTVHYMLNLFFFRNKKMFCEENKSVLMGVIILNFQLDWMEPAKKWRNT